MRAIKRSSIKGFTLRFKGYSLEVVFIKLIPCVLALYKGNKLIKRLEH